MIDYWLKTSLKKSDKDKDKDTIKIKTRKTRRVPVTPNRSQKRKMLARAEGEKKADGEKKEEAPKITLEILDSSGKVIRKFPKKEEPAGDEESFFGGGRGGEDLPADAGLNRFVWDLRYEGATKVPKAPLWGRQHGRADCVAR